MLINRRSLLQVGTCAAVLPLASNAMGHWLPAAAGGGSRIPFHKVLVDRDHPAAAAFGRAGQDAGLPVEPVGTHLTALWCALTQHWRQQRSAIAGLTTEPVALYLQLLAQDAGLRLVLRTSHTVLDDGRIRHQLTGPAATVQRAVLLDSAERWPLGALALVNHCPAELSSKTTITRISPAGVASMSKEPRLVSWVLAPVARNQHGHYI